MLVLIDCVAPWLMESGMLVNLPNCLRLSTQLKVVKELSMRALYEPYGVFLGYFDHSSAIRLCASDGFSIEAIQNINSRFTRECQRVGQADLNDGYFKPQFATSFGYTDEMAFVVVNDLSKISHVASCTPELENYTIAYPYSADFLNTEREIFKSCQDTLNFSTPLANSEPLIAVTHFKFSGILTLAFGINVQVAILSLIANRIESLLDNLSAELRETHAKLFAPEDFSSVSFSFLDPLSSDDLVMVFRGRNYSVIATIIAAIRNLTFKDLWNYSKSSPCNFDDVINGKTQFLKDEFSPKEFLNRFARSVDPLNLQAKSENGISPLLDCNHICSSSYTSLGIVGTITDLKEKTETISGVVHSHLIADINPGHELNTISNLRAEPIIPEDFTNDEFQKLRLVLPGKNDLDEPVAEEMCVPSLVKTTELIKYVMNLFGAKNKNRSESGFLDLNNHISIPIPRIYSVHENDGDNYSILVQLLEPPLIEEQHIDTMARIESAANVLSEMFHLEEPEVIHSRLRRIKVTASARVMVVRLLNEYVTALKDPLLYDTVLDLLDSFLSLYRLTEKLSKGLSSQPRSERISYVFRSRKLITALTEDLRNTFHLRIGRSSVKDEEKYNDLRGSLTNLLNANETAIKSAIGIVRHAKGEVSRFTSTTSGLICTKINQRAIARIARMPGQSIVTVDLEASHTLNIEYLARVLHEVGHLYFELFECGDKTDLLEVVSQIISDKSYGDNLDLIVEQCFTRLSEVFADSIVLSVVFNNDVELFNKYHCFIYASVHGETMENSLSNGSAREFMVHYVEIVYRLFVVTQLAGGKPFSEQSIEEHTDNFLAFVESIKEYRPPTLDIDESDLFAMFIKYSQAMYVYRDLFSKQIPPMLDKFNQTVVEACKSDSEWTLGQLRKAFSAGLPIPLTKPDAPVDEMPLVFQIVYSNIEATFGRYQFSDYDVIDSVFCLSPEERRELNSLTILSVKMLYHISCRQRARRLNDLLALIE